MHRSWTAEGGPAWTRNIGGLAGDLGAIYDSTAGAAALDYVTSGSCADASCTVLAEEVTESVHGQWLTRMSTLSDQGADYWNLERKALQEWVECTYGITDDRREEVGCCRGNPGARLLDLLLLEVITRKRSRGGHVCSHVHDQVGIAEEGSMTQEARAMARVVRGGVT